MRRTRRLHPAWIVAAVAFLALVGAAGFRSAPSALIVPLQTEFGWSISELSAAVSINILLFGLTAPFAALVPYLPLGLATPTQQAEHSYAAFGSLDWKSFWSTSPA